MPKNSFLNESNVKQIHSQRDRTSNFSDLKWIRCQMDPLTMYSSQNDSIANKSDVKGSIPNRANVKVVRSQKGPISIQSDNK